MCELWYRLNKRGQNIGEYQQIGVWLVSFWESRRSPKTLHVLP
jgi:hypothetical protein